MNRSKAIPQIENLKAADVDAIKAAIFAGRSFEAAMMCKTALNSSLSTALKAVNRWEVELRRNYPAKFQFQKGRSAPPLKGLIEMLPEPTRQAVNNAIFEGRRVNAVRICRTALGSSPRDAAASVDRRTTELRLKFPERFAGEESKSLTKPSPPLPARTGPLAEELEKLASTGKVQRLNIEAIQALLQTGHVFHKSWGLGEILRVDTVYSRMMVDFADRPNHSIDLNFSTQILTPVSDPNEFLATHHPEIGKVNWKLLGPGQVGLAEVTRHLESIQGCRGARKIDTSRIRFLLERRPDKIFVGIDEFDGYLAFIFERARKAVMENPQEGNAIYVFGNDWKQLSRLTKTEIMHSRWQHERIVHTGEWQRRLMRCLR